MIKDIKIEFKVKPEDFVIDESIIDTALKMMELTNITGSDIQTKDSLPMQSYNPLFNSYRALS